MGDLEYSVRESSRAKRVILRVLPKQGLEVVIPRGFDPKTLPEIVGKHSAWIRNALKRVESDRESLFETSPLLPGEIQLRALNVCFWVQYTQTRDSVVKLTQASDHRMEFSGNCADEEACLELLGRWLRHQGRLHLIPWLEEVSAELGLGFMRAQVRSQKSRWGSCSSKGTINLNRDLLFLPAELVRYILIHELCHTRVLNHSRKFWAVVAKHEPGFKALDARMKGARTYIPPWVRK